MRIKKRKKEDGNVPIATIPTTRFDRKFEKLIEKTNTEGYLDFSNCYPQEEYRFVNYLDSILKAIQMFKVYKHLYDKIKNNDMISEIEEDNITADYGNYEIQLQPEEVKYFVIRKLRRFKPDTLKMFLKKENRRQGKRRDHVREALREAMRDKFQNDISDLL